MHKKYCRCCCGHAAINSHGNGILSGKRRIAALTMAFIMLFIMPITVFAEAGVGMGASDTAYSSDGVDFDVLSAVATEPEISHASSAYLYNIENDRVLYEYKAKDRVYPASTVKIMTAIVAFEKFADALETKITITQEMLDEASGNRIGFSAGEIVTVEQMLYCMLVNSANDAAIILAYASYGGIEQFVSMMNEKANWLGAFDTFYTNPTGMHSDAMVTTARDTAVIAKYAYSIPGLIDMTSTPKYVMPETNMSDYRNIYNRNCMVSKYYSVDYYYGRAVGMNAGATTQGGYSLCGVAEDAENGLTYIAVALGCTESDGAFYNYVNVRNMFDWAFSSYGYTTVLSSSKMICEMRVRLSSTNDYVTLVPERDISVYLPTSIVPERDLTYSYNTYEEAADAPIEAGQDAGSITVMYGDEILGSCALITTSTVTRSEFLYFLSRVQRFTDSRFFRATVVSAVVLSIAYVLVRASMRERKLRRRR